MCADTTADTPQDLPDYKDTLNLPKTDFPMRAGLPKREPEWLARWNEIAVYDTLRERATGRTPFTLHDGPPYANGASPAIKTKATNSNSTMCNMRSLCDIFYSLYIF